MVNTKFDNQLISKLDILNSTDLLNISGGEIVVSAQGAADIGSGAGYVLQRIAEGWNGFWSGVRQGYNEHRK